MIIALKKDRLDEVCQVHESVDPGSFLHDAGYGLHFKKEVFYDAILNSKEAACLLYLIHDRIAGFLPMVRDADRFHRTDVVSKHLFQFCTLLCRALLRKPSIMAEFINQSLTISNYLKQDRLSSVPHAIVGFGVSESHRGLVEKDDGHSRVSHELFVTAARQFKAWGAREFKLFTPSANKPALIFYLQHGGQVSGSFNPRNQPQVGIYFETETVLRLAESGLIKENVRSCQR
jgi:hypothetical protein